MRVHLALLLAVCVPAARTTGCGYSLLEFSPVVEGVAGPAAAAGTEVTQFCAGYSDGIIQGWKALRGELTSPEGHVPRPLLKACIRPTCGSESYQDGYARGLLVGDQWARRYP